MVPRKTWVPSVGLNARGETSVATLNLEWYGNDASARWPKCHEFGSWPENAMRYSVRS